jgi:arsenate reductase (thioredoxin)
MINPTEVAAMLEKGIDKSDAQPKPLVDETVEFPKIVITVGSGDACKFYPGKRYEN